MKDAYEVLKQKEAELSRVRHEVESLKMVASLLAENSNSDPSDEGQAMSGDGTEEGVHAGLDPTGTDTTFSSDRTPRSTLWSVLKRPK